MARVVEPMRPASHERPRLAPLPAGRSVQPFLRDRAHEIGRFPDPLSFGKTRVLGRSSSNISFGRPRGGAEGAGLGIFRRTPLFISFGPSEPGRGWRDRGKTDRPCSCEGDRGSSGFGDGCGKTVGRRLSCGGGLGEPGLASTSGGICGRRSAVFALLPTSRDHL